MKNRIRLEMGSWQEGLLEEKFFPVLTLGLGLRCQSYSLSCALNLLYSPE